MKAQALLVDRALRSMADPRIPPRTRRRRRSLPWLAALGVLAAVLAAAATASAQVEGPAMPAAAGPDPCTPSKRVVCGPAVPPGLGTAVGRHEQALNSARIRRGLGLPSLRRLFGRAGARAQALADARLAGTAKAARAARVARTAGAAPLKAVGAVGAVSVQATAAPGLGAGVDEITFADRITGPNGSQSRSVRFTATAAACPVAALSTANVGKDDGMMLAALHIVTTQRSGRLELTTDFTIDTTGRRDYWGAVNGRAELQSIQPTPDAFVRIRRVRRARDLRTGRRYREKPLELRWELKSFVPLAMLSADPGFDRFVQQYGSANGDDPADSVVDDGLLDGDAFEAAAQTFMLAVGAKAWTVFKTAEQQWRTPNRCVEAHGDIPARLIPGRSVQVRVSATSRRGDPPANLRAYARFAPYRSAGVAVDPYAFVEPDADVGATFTVTPPAQAWPDDDPQRLRFVFSSTGGIGAVDADLRAQSLPIRYRVLSASYAVRTTASQPGGICAGFGGTSEVITLSGDATGITQDITDAHTLDGNVLDGASLDGPLHGGIWGKAALNVAERFAGCRTDPATQHLVACSVDYGTTRLPSAITIGFTIQVPGGASGDANLQWLVNAAGSGNASDKNCNMGLTTLVPRDSTVQTVPLSRLLSTDPQTFTFARQIHLDRDAVGKPASIDVDWTYSVTVERR